MSAFRRVFLAAALGSTLSATAQITNPAPYCAAGYDDANGFAVPHYISNVSFGTLSNNTGNNQYAAPHYAYYNGVTAPNLTKGTSYPLSVTHNGGTTIHFVAVYIDFNKNNSFADPGERVLQQTINGNITNPATANVMIPTTAATGTTRMRVMVFEDDDYTWIANNANATPCTANAGGSLDWGETEDYNVNITGGGGGIPAPAAAFTASAVTGTVNSTIQFTDNSTGAPTSWKWSVTPASVTYVNGTGSTSANPAVQFTAPGNYTVKLVVSNAGGSDSLVKTNYIQINAGPAAPVAAFSASPLNATVATNVFLTDQSLNLPTAWKWTFTPNTVSYQGGTNSTSANPVVKCTVPGLYTVQLVVSNALGKDSVTQTNYLNITPVPLVDFKAGSTTGTTASTFVIYDLSAVVPQSRHWSFSPATVQYLQGTDSSSITPVVRFTQPGSYTVRLQVQHAGGTDMAEKRDYIHISQGPTGVAEMPSMELGMVYPNPAREKLYLSPALVGARLELVDLTGRTVAVADRAGSEWSLQGITPGMYLLRIGLQGQVWQQKLVVAH